MNKILYKNTNFNFKISRADARAIFKPVQICCMCCISSARRHLHALLINSLSKVWSFNCQGCLNDSAV